MNASLEKQLPSIVALCQRFEVAHLELFGSATSAEFNPESSDFDFLVELDKSSPGSPVRRWIGLAEELEKLLGRHVDLVNPHYIRKPYFAQAVNASRPFKMSADGLLGSTCAITAAPEPTPLTLDASR